MTTTCLSTRSWLPAAMLLAAALCAPAVAAASLTRGPYLQQATDTSIVVKWRTDSATDSIVRYGSNAATLDQSVVLGGARSDHELTLNGLASATTYFYSIDETAGTLAGDASYFFRTAPTAQALSPTRIWVIGDSGTANSNAFAVRDAYKTFTGARGTDLWLMLGDNAYPNGTDAEYQNAVFNTYPELLRQVPLWSTLGNHDGFSADSATQTGPYYEIFSLPDNAQAGGVPSGTEAYYSFDYGNIHFVVLDSHETSRATDGAMLGWLENDLAFQTNDWLIAFWHHPPYTRGSHNSDLEIELIQMRENALPILESYGVDLVLSGHSHSYERSVLLDGHYGDSASLTGVMVLDGGDGREGGDGVYAKPTGVAVANSGAVYAVAGSSGLIGGGLLDHPVMHVSLNELGSMVIDVDGSRLDASFLNSAGQISDSFTIDKDDGADTVAPVLLDAVALSDTRLQLQFSEPLDAPSAEQAGNYAVDQGIGVVAATLATNARSVELTVMALTHGTTYSVTVNGVTDVAGNPIAPDSRQSLTYLRNETRRYQDGVAPQPGYTGTSDTYLVSALPDTNNGNATVLLLDGDDPPGSGGDLVTLLRWDISGIPVDATVTAASVEIDVFNTSFGGYDVYQALRSWDEAAATWNVATATDSWAGPGAQGAGDRGSDVLATIRASEFGVYSVALNATGLAVVQGWVDGSAANNGFVIFNLATGDGLDFYASDYTVDASSRPALSISYDLAVAAPDSDADGVPDDVDNCIASPNPLQIDSNGDGYGNRCDADLNDDCVVNAQDLGLLRTVFFQADADADFNSDGVVNAGDLGILRSGFFAPPGPSAVTQVCD